MRIRFPLSGTGATTVAATPSADRPRLRLPLSIANGGAGRTGVTNREERALRAVAAAAALAKDAEAIALARQIKDDPGAVFRQAVIDTDIDPVLKAVGRYLDDATGAPAPDQNERQVAQAVRGSPELVAAAYAAMKDNAGNVVAARATAAQLWVAQAGSGSMLDLAGRTAGRITNPKLPDRTQTIEKLSDDVTALEADVQTIKRGVAGVDGRATDNANKISALEGRADNLDNRVTRLEGGSTYQGS